MVELVIGQRAQPVAGNVEAGAAQGIGLFLGRDTLDPGAEATGDRAGQGDLEAAAAVFGEERAVGADVRRFGAE